MASQNSKTKISALGLSAAPASGIGFVSAYSWLPAEALLREAAGVVQHLTKPRPLPSGAREA